MKPEDRARVEIDRQLAQAGWAVQDSTAVDLHAARGVAVREFPLVTGHGKADYLLYVDRKAVGAVEAKKAGTTLSAVEIQAAKYSEGLPTTQDAALRALRAGQGVADLGRRDRTRGAGGALRRVCVGGAGAEDHAAVPPQGRREADRSVEDAMIVIAGTWLCHAGNSLNP